MYRLSYVTFSMKSSFQRMYARDIRAEQYSSTKQSTYR